MVSTSTEHGRHHHYFVWKTRQKSSRAKVRSLMVAKKLQTEYVQWIQRQKPAQIPNRRTYIRSSNNMHQLRWKRNQHNNLLVEHWIYAQWKLVVHLQSSHFRRQSLFVTFFFSFQIQAIFDVAARIKWYYFFSSMDCLVKIKRCKCYFKISKDKIINACALNTYSHCKL